MKCEPEQTKLEKFHLTEFMAMNTSKSHAFLYSDSITKTLA